MLFKLFSVVFFVLFFQECGYTMHSLYPDYKPDPNAYEENYPIDRREFTRFANNSLKFAITAKNPENGDKFSVIDFSRGGIAFSNMQKFNVGESYKVIITYKNIKVPVEVEIVSIDDNRIGAKFIDIDISAQNKLLFISASVELDNNLLKTKLSV